MRAENDVGCETFDLSAELARVEFFGRAFQFPDERVAAWPIRFRVQIGPELRELLHQPDVLLAVERPEILRHEGEQIEMRRDERRMRGRSRFDDGFRGAQV